MRIREIFFLTFIIFFYQVLAFSAVKTGYPTDNFKNNNSVDSIITHQINYQQNFEEGHTNGWESYPPSQDTGFDPNFYCEKINGPNNSKYSLLLKYPASFETEYEMGFIKKISLISSDNLKVSFDYKADGYGDFKNMDIVLYGSDKKQYSYSLTVQDDGNWNNVTIARANFKNSGQSITPLIAIEGFSIEAHIPKTNPDILYRLYFDNLIITALQPVKFKIEIPKSDYLENMDMIIPLHHYSTGEDFNISTKIIDKINLESVKVNLYDPKDNLVLKDINLTYDKDKKTWNRENLYKFSNNDEPGQWEVELLGNDNSGKKVKTNFKIWLTEKKLSHPRMYFANDKINYYKEKIKNEHWKIWWDSLTVRAERIRKNSNLGSITFGVPNSSITETNPIKMSLESLRNVDLSVYDTVYLLPTLRHYFNIMVGAMNQLQENALIYAINGDTAAGNYAKEALVIISGWKTWTHPWFNARHRETYYPVGELGVRAAFCYDVVYDLMNDEERKKVSEGLLKNCIIPAYQEYVLEDRIPSATSNWVGNTVSGGISAALAIYGDNPELNLEPYISGLIKKLEDHINFTLDTSGAWGEGISYQAFSYSNVLPTLSVIKNVLKLDLSNKYIFNSYKYFLYNFSDPVVFDVGDSHAGASTLSNFAWISSNTKDPIFNWFYQKSPKENVLDFLFGEDEGETKSPEGILPSSALFNEIGAAVFRSEWSDEDILLNFRSGAFYNHQHFDQGSIQLRAFGETLIPEAGWANYYNDPWYPRYYIQPVGHSTLLLDENAGSQRSGDYNNFFIGSANKHAKITDFITTNFYSAATGEISDVYRGKLDQFERNIIFLNKKYFVIFDRLKSAKDPHEYDLLFHFQDSKNVNLKENNIFTFNEDKASLYSQVLFPENIKMKKVEGPINLSVPIKKPGYVQVSNSNKSMEENFLTILYPQKGKKPDDLSKKITKLNSGNYIGFSFEENDQEDILLFNTGNKNIETDKILTDGKIAEVTLKNNKPLIFAAQNTSNFSYDGKKLIETDVPVTFSTKLSKEKDVWNINSDQNGEAKINLSSEPVKIILDDKEINKEQFKILGEKLIISISAGENNIKIDYKN